jgi:putative transposase
MIRTETLLIQPTKRQTRELTRLLKNQCELYNAALEERVGSWNWYDKRAVTRVKPSISKYDQFNTLAGLKEVRPEILDFGSTVCRGTLTRLDLAYQAFFCRTKAGEKPGFPRYKSHHRFDSVTWPYENGWKIKDQSHLYLRGIGTIRFKTSKRGIRGIPKTLTLKRHGRKWYVTLQCDGVEPTKLESTGREVGIDLGVTHLLTTSEGTHIPNPRYFRTSESKLKKAQQLLSTKTKWSNRRRTQAQRVATIHRKISNQRKDHAHKLSRTLINDFDLIVHEDLKIRNMVRRPKPKPSPNDPTTFEPNGASSKAGLDKSIHDAGWGQLLNFLSYKAEEAGRELIEVDPRYTSQTCSHCGHVAKENRVKSQFRCLKCGHEANADINAAINIYRLGLSQRKTSVEREASREIVLTAQSNVA